MNRAYSTIQFKAVDEETGTITGIASTPSPDRMGDIVEPDGAVYNLPIPLLWQHDSYQPIGNVIAAKVTKKGIEITAQIARGVTESIDDAWKLIKAGLVRGLSIGFRGLDTEQIPNSWGVIFQKWEWLELSCVTIPANADASITSVKSIDRKSLAASGKLDLPVVRLQPPGASGKSTPKTQVKETTTMKTLAEQIAALKAKRANTEARMEAVMQKSMNEDRSTTSEEQVEFDDLEAELEAIDKDLARLAKVEKAKAGNAQAVPQVDTERGGSQARAPVVVKTRPAHVPGIQFARVAKCIGMAKGNLMQAEQIAKQRYANDDAVVNVIKAAVVAGSTASGNWAEDLVGDETSVFADFVEFLRPQTILGKFGAGGIPSLRRVPFRTPLIGQTGGGDGYWVGQGKPKPLTAFDFSRSTLEPLKVANIAVLTMELLRDSSPSAEMLVRDGLAAALRERLDTDFIDPTKTASAGVSPASVTNGVSAIHSTGNDADAIREDIRQLFGTFIAANNAPTSGVWIMSATTALAVSQLRNPLGQKEFPEISMLGGTLEGLPVIVSEYVGSVSAGGYVFLVNAQDVYLSDDGGIRIDMSNQASLEMKDSSLTQDATAGTGTSLVSLWQTNAVGFLAERTINWAKRRAGAVAVLDQVNWGVPGS